MKNVSKCKISESMEGAPKVDILQCLQKYNKVSTSEVPSNRGDTTAVVTEHATRVPSNSHYTLAEMLKSSGATSGWDGNRVADEYRKIIRDVIEEISELVKHCDQGYLTPNHICIVNDRAKIHVNIPNPPNRLPTYRSQFGSLVMEILGSDTSTRPELEHFYRMVDKTALALDDLFYHPLLMSSNERFYFPIDADLILRTTKGNDWSNEYNKDKKINIEAKIKSSNSEAFKSFYNKSSKENTYEDNELGVLEYSRKISIHLEEEQNTLTKVEVEKELTSLFPERLTCLYDFLNRIGISMPLLTKRRAESS